MDFLYRVLDAATSYVKYPHVTVGKKVKYTLIQALRLCTGPTAHRGSRGIALPFLDQRH